MTQVFGLRKWLVALASALIMSLSGAVAAEFSPNFKGTDIQEFIHIVGKNLHRTIVVDPNVRGKVNVRSYDLLNEAQYYQFFLNVLDVYGYAVVEMDNGVLKVIPGKKAKTAAIPVVGEDGEASGDQMITRVVSVKNVPVRELAPLLRQLINQGGNGNVVHYNPSNVIMITGPAAVVQRLVEVIRRVDKAGDQNVELVKLHYASAGEIVRIVEKLNRPVAGKNDTPAFLIPKLVADERTNTVIVSGERKARDRVIKLIKRLDSELETSGNTKVYYLKYAKAEDLVQVLKGVSDTIAAEEKQGQSRGVRSRTAKAVSIEAHEESNSLVITAQPDMMRSLEDVIRQLDVRRLQVLVEAIIVEVFEGDGANLGVQWISKDGGIVQYNNGNSVPIGQLAAAAISARGQKGNTVTTIDSNGNPVTTKNPDTLGDYTLLAQLLGSVNGTLYGIINEDWGALVQAVKSSTNSNILATPSLVTLDNQEADFVVGQDVPTITGSTTGTNNANPFQTVTRTEVVIKLKVTPQVNEGDAVQLTIEQEVSSVAGATAVDITINKREIKTTVLADDGKTIVLGGLIDEDVQESVSKVPLLGDLPLIGSLFRSTSTTKKKRNLLVFIRPTIIRDSTLLNQISQRKYNYIRAEQLDLRSKGIRLMSDDKKQPLLRQWDEQELVLPPGFDEAMKARQQQVEDDQQ